MKKIVLAFGLGLLALSSCKKQKIENLSQKSEIAAHSDHETFTATAKIYAENEVDGYALVTYVTNSEKVLDVLLAEAEGLVIKRYKGSELINELKSSGAGLQSDLTSDNTPKEIASDIDLAQVSVNYDFSNLLGIYNEKDKVAFAVSVRDESKSSTLGWFTSYGMYPSATVTPYADEVLVWNNTNSGGTNRMFSSVKNNSGNQIYWGLLDPLEMISASSENSVYEVRGNAETVGYFAKFQVLWIFN